MINQPLQMSLFQEMYFTRFQRLIFFLCGHRICFPGSSGFYSTSLWPRVFLHLDLETPWALCGVKLFSSYVI